MYTPLYIKTDYSLLSSLIKIDDLIIKLKKMGITSCGICDDNLYGTMEFFHKCNNNNIKPVIGLDLGNILLFAKSKEGYYNLVKIETYKNFDKLSDQIIKKYCSDLVVITFNRDDYDKYKYFSDIYIGINDRKKEKEYSDLETVYINKTLYLDKALYKYLPYVFMIRDGRTISDGIDFKYDDNYLFSYDDLTEIVSSKSLNNTLKISDMCNIGFKKELFMPKYAVNNYNELN